MKSELVPENGDPPIPITRDLTLIGRREYCDVVINHHSLSKRHCVVVRTDGLLVIRDLATTNGTKVKGQRVRWAALLPDDRITLGNYKMRVYLGPDHAPSPSELARDKGKERSARPVKAGAGTGAGAADARARPRAAVSDAPEIRPEVPGTDEGPDSDDSGWRRLLAADPKRPDDDLIIELD
jgi:predicted component of type VI protein secretion system